MRLANTKNISSKPTLKIIFLVPLQPCRTSMPSTCSEGKQWTVKNKPKIQNIISRLFCVINRNLVTQLITDSIDNLTQMYFGGRHTSETNSIHTQLPGFSHSQLLSVFLLLLNIDQALKETVMVMDVTQNHRKITRFYMDLKLDAVVKFFSTESMSVSDFVHYCEELYIIS